MGDSEVTRRLVGVVQDKHHVAACANRDSLWVEIAGPKGGRAWQMAPGVALRLSALLTAAAEQAYALDARDER